MATMTPMIIPIITNSMTPIMIFIFWFSHQVFFLTASVFLLNSVDLSARVSALSLTSDNFSPLSTILCIVFSTTSLASAISCFTFLIFLSVSSTSLSISGTCSLAKIDGISSALPPKKSTLSFILSEILLSLLAGGE